MARAELSVAARAAGQGVGHESDLMTARDLLSREIEHMAKQPTDGRTQNMHDAQGPWPASRWSRRFASLRRDTSAWARARRGVASRRARWETSHAREDYIATVNNG